MRRKYQLRRNVAIKSFLQYGFHLWILLFISNILILYSFNLFSFGAAPKDSTAVVSPGVSGEPSAKPSAKAAPTLRPTTPPYKPPEKKPTPKPALGPVVSLSFALPGIGSGGGTMNPIHKTRNVFIFLYATDVNSFDSKIKPLNTIRTTATFDDNPYSPTYTAFVNDNIDLGDSVKKGRYQIAFSTDQSMRNLVKEKENAIGGKIINLLFETKNFLPLQKAVMGDMVPLEGDNVMDINDYNLFVACYAKNPPCPQLRQVDLNDDGMVDGIDYNIMALGFKSLVAQGYPAPQLPTVAPTQVSKLSELKITPKAKPTVKVSAAPSPAIKKTSGGNPLGAFFGFLFFLALLGGGGFFLLTHTKFGKDFLAKHPLPAKVPPAPGGKEKETAPPPSDAPAPAEPPSIDSKPLEEAIAASPSAESIAATTEIPVDSVAESTEISIEDLKKEKESASQPAETPPADKPAAPAPAADASAVDKTYYVKKKATDDKGTWVVLTDDAGPIDGLLPKGDIEDGFERIKGTMKDENGKKYLLIQEVLPSE